jgi:hypothetical protein
MACGNTSDGATVHSLDGTGTNTAHSWITSVEKYVLGWVIGLQQVSLCPQRNWTQDLRAQKSAKNHLRYGTVPPSHISTYLWETTNNINLVKEFRNRPGVAQRVPGGLGSQISWHSAHGCGEVVSLTHRPPLPPGDVPGTHFHNINLYKHKRTRLHNILNIANDEAFSSW